MKKKEGRLEVDNKTKRDLDQDREFKSEPTFWEGEKVKALSDTSRGSDTSTVNSWEGSSRGVRICRCSRLAAYCPLHVGSTIPLLHSLRRIL